MDAAEPHVRRRGLFFDLDTGDPDTGEYEATEGIAIRVGIPRPRIHRSLVSASSRRPPSAVHSASPEFVSHAHQAAAPPPPLRSTSVTDTHPPARTHR